jgi:elongation factor P--(R)-beta-lysine ligase
VARSTDAGPASEAERLAGRRAALEARAAVRRAVRSWFEGQGFLEVETPLRVPSPGQEVHLEAIPADRGRYLVTSPEYHMKRLAGAGFDRIVQLGRAFRQGEQGPHHEPEFTMLEWYRARVPLSTLAEDCERILEIAARAVGRWPEVPIPAARSGGPAATLSLAAPGERTTVRALLRRHAGIEVGGDESADELRAMARRAGVTCAAGAAWDDVFFQLFLDRVEPHLGRGRPTFVFDWPAPLAALARRRSDDPRTADRFELYAGGLELANAFAELTDPTEQRARFLEECALRRARGKTIYPIDERLLDALGRMPPTCGAALGFDRLVMLVTGAEQIRAVMAFSDEEA